jgi:acetylglutamate kinase
MRTRTLTISLAVVAMAASGAAAANLTERLQTGRMTVIGLDHATGRFHCAEHRRWTRVIKADLRGVHLGDIVRVEQAAGKPTHIVVVRAAADELSSPE